MEIYKRTFKTITVNGRTYSSADEMPPDVRAQFEQAMGLLADKNNNGIPDAFEGLSDPKAVRTIVQQVVTQTGTVHRDGVTTSKPLLQASWSSGGQGGSGVTLSWPTLLALLATVAVIAAAIAWYVRR